MAVEATPAKVLSFLRRSVVGVLNRNCGVGGHIHRHRRQVTDLRGRTRIEDVLRGNDDLRRVFELDTILHFPVRMVRRQISLLEVRRGTQVHLPLECRRVCCCEPRIDRIRSLLQQESAYACE